MILLLHGADQLAIRNRLAALRSEADDGTGMVETNLTDLDGRTAKPGEILGAAMSMPFLSPKRMVVVTGLLDRFGVLDASGRSRPLTPPSIKPLQPLFDGLDSGVPETTILVFTGGELPRQNALKTRLKKIAGVEDEEYKVPRGQQLEARLAEEGKARGLRLDQRAAKALAGRIGGDTLQMASELDKLALYTGGAAPTVADIEAVCVMDRAARSFEFTDALLDGKLAQAWRAQRTLTEAGLSIEELLAYFLEVLRTVARVADMDAQGSTPEEIGKAIRQPYPNLRDRTIQRARRLGLDGVRRAYEIAVGIDRERKQGEIPSDVALELLIGRMLGLRGR